MHSIISKMATQLVPGGPHILSVGKMLDFFLIQKGMKYYGCHRILSTPDQVDTITTSLHKPCYIVN